MQIHQSPEQVCYPLQMTHSGFASPGTGQPEKIRG